ncbi:MAG: DNA polymerase III subunit beta [Thermodesulfobacteriota bacterium]
MEFLIKKAVFLKSLQRIQGIVEKRNTMPILSNVLIEAVGSKVNIIATDLEVFIKDSIEATVKTEGAVTVNARKIFEIIKELPDENVDISVNKDSKVTIKGGKAKFNIMGLPSKDFPAFPVIDESKLEDIHKDILKEMVDKTSFAVSMDETRYNINGFLLEKDGSKIRMVATDGHRLALVEKTDDLGFGIKDKKSVLLPRKGMMEIRKLLEEDSKTGFKISITDKSAAMKKDDTLINIRLLEGEFPDYKKVIPENNNKSVMINRNILLASLKRVSILSADKIKGVNFKFSKDSLNLNSSNPDIGDATEELTTKYTEPDVEIAFNATYMIDMLEAVDDESIEIKLKDALSPGILGSPKTNDYTYIIMPMRL